MNILVIDKFNAPRDPAQMDMYKAMECIHDVSYGTPSDIIHSWAWDVLYLGIYHQVLPIDYTKIDCPVIIDQADNEDFVRRLTKIPYSNIKTPKVFLSRYLPNEALQAVIPEAKQLSWYIDPERVIYRGDKKSIDVSFICTIHGNRTHYAEVVRSVCKKNGWSCYVGQAWGEEYLQLLRKTRLFIAECSRKCYTQKYTEAILCGCTIMGDRPLYPANDIQMIESRFTDLESTIRKGLEQPMLQSPEFANKRRFLVEFENILSGLVK